jgi:hypothetical protein
MRAAILRGCQFQKIAVRIRLSAHFAGFAGVTGARADGQALAPIVFG